MILTRKYRIKDSSSAAKLSKISHSVNRVWNYCNEANIKSVDYNQKWLSNFDLHKLTSGVASDLGLVSETVQGVADEYVIKRRKFKKKKLSWRGKKSLGWIPFKKQSIKYLGEGKVKYNKTLFQFWETQFVGTIKCGSFNQDSRGRWYVNLVCEVDPYHYAKTGKSIGVDLGLKATATYSDGTSFVGSKSTKEYEDRLAMAQRAGKKKRTKVIHAKIANTRKDSLHKETLRLVKEYDLIVVGNVSSKGLIKTRMAKSVQDVSWGAYKTLLAYKTIRFGKEMKVVNESWTSRTCSACLERSGPSGLSGLSVREWQCSCGASHDRDVNAAKNILRIGHDTPIKGIPVKEGCQSPYYRTNTQVSITEVKE